MQLIKFFFQKRNNRKLLFDSVFVCKLFQKTLVNLHERCKVRRNHIEESTVYFTVLNSHEDLMRWIEGKLITASLDNFGKNLDETRRLRRKHSQLEQEIKQHEVLISELLGEYKKLVGQNHFAHEELTTKHDELEQKWTELKLNCTARNTRLDEAFRIHEYYVEADELIEWLNDKQSNLASFDYVQEEKVAMMHSTELKFLVRILAYISFGENFYE